MRQLPSNGRGTLERRPRSFFGTCTPCHDDAAPLTRRCRRRAARATAASAPSGDYRARRPTVAGTTPGCHGVAPVVVTTTLTAKVTPATVVHGKSVKVTGVAGPAASLAGAKAALKVERKVGTKWVKMKTGSATVKASGAYTWTYRTTAKKGASPREGLDRQEQHLHGEVDHQGIQGQVKPLPAATAG